ncbi:UNVERIFIED_CONTAM: hypothetical protein Sradi_3883700 [Sesamum radiatum]|uniref:Ribosomal protein L34Ae n=1 Tax=Sesamum radiatum TaxID=300843 RepID=A0AAW2PHB7_SESRA
MVLIPEETSPADEEEEEEEGETSSSEWRDVEAEGRQFWSGFDAVYDIYCERMLFFDRSSSQHLLEVGSHVVSTPSPRSGSKKLASPLACLSLRKFEAPEEEIEHLQQPVSDPHHDLENAYVAQVCLTWEALHCQYTQLSQKISCQPESPTSYNHSAQQFQQFQVLLQRFIENEPFEHGSRPEIYARTRKSMPKLLQVPKIQASEEKSTGEGEEASNLKKEMKLKELWKRSRSYKKKSWPSTAEDVEMLLGLVDVKVLTRVVRMMRISKEQLIWCEEKMKKLGLCNGKLHREPSPILFPC